MLPFKLCWKFNKTDIFKAIQVVHYQQDPKEAKWVLVSISSGSNIREMSILGDNLMLQLSGLRVILPKYKHMQTPESYRQQQ